jgi:hypothetical protein
MTTLTDRYIWAVQRSLPEHQRDDIDLELRATIADTIDAKLESGLDASSAEHEAIVELGDPYRLAAGYTDRPLHLIGPALFPDYIRLLKVLFAVVLPIGAAGIFLAMLLGQPETVGEVAGPFIAALMGLIVHLGFWPTLVFAILERSPDTKWYSWKPENLPDLPVGNSIKLSDTVASVSWMVVILAGIAWGQFWPLFRDDSGAVIPFFAPELWSFWLPYFIVLAVAGAVFYLTLYRNRRWTWLFAVLNMALGLAAVIPLLWLLLTEQAVNPEFLAAADIAPLFAADGVVTIVLLVVLLASWLTDAVAGFVKARRGERGRA